MESSDSKFLLEQTCHIGSGMRQKANPIASIY